MDDVAAIGVLPSSRLADGGAGEWDVALAEGQLKANLAGVIARAISALQLTQQQAGELMGLKQPKVCDIVAGRLKGYSGERLMRFLLALGQNIDVSVHPSTRGIRPRIHVDSLI